MNTTVRSLFVAAALFALAEGWPASTAAQDLGALLSPGPLSAAHANLEGIKTCDSCHEPGQGISTKKCLSCHKPIAERMAAGKGVHREVTGDCAMCHAEHAGRDADIRPLDISDFDHLEETGFPLDGMHASLTGDCAKCHTTRSYLAVTPECSTCHKDPHGGVLGVTCANCHATSAAFLETGMAFDHSTAAFQLDGAHTEVECAKCHSNKTFRGVAFGECSDCHKDPHGGALGASCAGCHVSTAAFATTNVDHNATGFPLSGEHARVPCASCHRTGSTFVSRPEHNTVRGLPLRRPRRQLQRRLRGLPHRQRLCRRDLRPHRPNRFRPSGPPRRDPLHRVPQTAHEPAPCRRANRRLQAGFRPPARAATRPAQRRSRDFVRQLSRDPVVSGSRASNTPRRPSSSAASTPPPIAPNATRRFSTPSGSTAWSLPAPTADSRRAAPVATATPTSASSAPTAPHATRLTKRHFDASLFDHSRTDFKLTGRHALVPCETCHKEESGVFPAGSGKAVRFTGMSDACVTCHRDPHLGELGTTCQSCHSTGELRGHELHPSGRRGVLRGRAPQRRLRELPPRPRRPSRRTTPRDRPVLERLERRLRHLP